MIKIYAESKYVAIQRLSWFAWGKIKRWLVYLLIKDNVQVNITIMGSGELKDICKVFCLNMAGNVNLTYIEPVEYGQTFLDAFGSYDVVLVPNLKEEQPRIVFDAFSQGLCVIASDTSGILDITDEGNAVICKRGDPDSLAKAICYVIENPNIMLQMGLNGLNYADGKTHHQMHLDREKFLASVLDI